MSAIEAVGVCVEAVALVGIFIWDRTGTVSYEDIFGESHTITYQGLLDPKTGHFLMGDTDPRKAQDEKLA